MQPLKEATAEKHRIAEQKPFNQRMFKGQMSEAEYLLYLVQQREVYACLETYNLPHANLARTANVEADIDELLKKGLVRPDVLPSTQAYVDYLHQLNDEGRLAHVYLNYLAVMFGGQMMKKVVPSAGKMYEFDNMPEALQAVRMVQKDEWADEVNRGFDFNIEMFDELEAASKLSNQTA